MRILLKNYQADFDRGAHPLKECLWLFVKLFFFSLPYPLPSQLRCFLLRIFGANIGAGVVIRAGVDITFPWRLSIGNHSWIGDEVKLLNLANISIGDDCCISQRVFLCAGSHDFKSEKFNLITKPIIINNGTWIGALAFIGPGVVVGSSSMVAAASMISRNIPSQHVATGNPALLKKITLSKNII